MITKTLVWTLIGGAILVNCTAVLAAKANKILFNEITIQAPFVLTHPVIAADLLPGSGKEILTLGVDEHGLRWLAIYSYHKQSNQYDIAIKTAIPSEFSRFDLSDYQPGKLQHLYFMSAANLFVFNGSNSSSNNKFDNIATIDSIFLEDQPQFVSRGNFVHQLSDNGADNILITGFTRLTLLSVSAERSVVSSQSLAIRPRVHLSENSASFHEKKFYFSDINFDQLSDLILVGDGELRGYLQQPSGEFADEPMLITINQSISGIEWWSKRDATGSNLDQTDLVYRKLEELADINSDGVTDMIVRLTTSSGLLDRANDYEVYLGKNSADLLSFSTVKSSVIRADGTLTGFQLVDINNDNKMEVLLAGFDIGLMQIIGALLSGSIDQDVFLFKMDQQDNFSAKPNISQEVELNFSISSGRSGRPVVKLADINGDGLKDLVLSDGEDLLKIYIGNNSKRLFAKRSKKYHTRLPKDGEIMQVDDINGDGKDDLIIKYGQLDDKSLLRTFKIYLSTAN